MDKYNKPEECVFCGSKDIKADDPEDRDEKVIVRSRGKDGYLDKSWDTHWLCLNCKKRW